MSFVPYILRGRRATAGVSRSRLVVACAVIPLLLGLAGRASAATRTWSGAGPDSNVSTAANWVGGVAPDDGDGLVFPPAATTFTVTQDTAFKFNSMAFSSSGSNVYNVNGTITIVTSIQFLRENGGATLTKTFSVKASGRLNVGVTGPGGDVPELANENFGAIINSDQAIAVERSMYSNAIGQI
jgi:hypothetical protein